MEFNHIPIMLSECIDGLNIKSNGVYVDGTIGGGGHSIEIGKRLSSNGTLIGIDKDLTAIETCKARLKNLKCKVILVQDDFRNLEKILQDLKIEKVDGILLDLGVSSYQIDNAERGFSYSKDGELDMRMNTSQSLDAKQIVNTYSEEHLAKIFFEYGEESFARRIARNIVNIRKIKPITTTGELKEIIEKSVPSYILHKGGSVAKKTFQALRIETNGELDALREVLSTIIDHLKVKGRICIITFHSLEDRIVKDFFKLESTDCICDKSFPVCVCNHHARLRLVNKKVIVPCEKEQEENKRSSSSKLRIAERI